MTARQSPLYANDTRRVSARFAPSVKDWEIDMARSRPPAYARKTDRNHAPIRQALRDAGWQVLDLSGVGRGVPDLLARRGDVRVWVEVKVDGEELTQPEAAFFEWAPGPKIIATDPALAVHELQSIYLRECEQ